MRTKKYRIQITENEHDMLNFVADHAFRTVPKDKHPPELPEALNALNAITFTQQLDRKELTSLLSLTVAVVTLMEEHCAKGSVEHLSLQRIYEIVRKVYWQVEPQGYRIPSTLDLRLIQGGRNSESEA